MTWRREVANLGRMYTPARFREAEIESVYPLIDGSPFATVIAVDQGKPFVSHLPLTRGERDGKMILIGHMARANPQWKLLRGGEDVTAIFHGPHAYISPTFYAEHDVPTWNYVVAHMRGPMRLLESHEEIVAVLRTQTRQFEPDGSWEFSLPEDLGAPGVLEKAIVGFEIEVREWVAKVKLGQNRASADQKGVVDGLRARGDKESEWLIEWMKRYGVGF